MKKTSHPDCAYCIKRHAELKERRDRWRSNGHCPGCGAPRKKYNYCVACRAVRAASVKAKRARLREAA